MDRHSGSIELQLYVSIMYAERSLRRYRWAADNSADDLVVTQIDRDSGGRRRDCPSSEAFGIDLDEKKLVGGLADPYQIKIPAKSGDALIVALDPAMIRGQLLAIGAHGGPPVPGDDKDVTPVALTFGATLETARPRPMGLSASGSALSRTGASPRPAAFGVAI
jgi:hypothetical protein